MTSAADDFAFDTDEVRGNAVEKFKALNISSGDEVEQLYHAVVKTMDDMNEQIVQIKTQAKRISDMQHNIIITMADIVESRDENTGGHIRRTAESVLSAILIWRCLWQAITTKSGTAEVIPRA